MPDARREAVNLVFHKRAEIDVIPDELDARNRLIEPRALFGEHARTSALLKPRERKESDKQREREKNGNKVCHGN